MALPPFHVLYADGFGALGDTEGVQGFEWLLAYVTCFFLLFLSLVSLGRNWARRRSLPWPGSR